MMTTLASDADVLERVGTALADPTRRRILTMLLVGPAYPGELAEVLDVSRAKTSNHLACLRGCGLVTATREGRQVRYELADERLAGAEVTGVVRPTSQTSRITTLTAAAIGSAISAPSSPASLAPTSRVTITVGADKSIALVMILGRMK